MSYLLFTGAVVLALTFAWSTAGKVRGRASWTSFVASTRLLLPPSWVAARLAPAGPAAGAVVAAEAAVAPLLVVLPLAGFVLASALLLAFSLAITLAVRRGVRAPCRCFGEGAGPLAYRHAVRAGLLSTVSLAGVVAIASGAEYTGEHPGALAVAVVVAVVLTTVTARLDDVADLFTAPATRRAPNP